MTAFSITRPNGTVRIAEMIDKGDRVTVRWNGQEKTTQIGGLGALDAAKLLLAGMSAEPRS